MGAVRESWSGLTDLRRSLRVPIGISGRDVALVRLLPAILRPDGFAHLQKLFHRQAMTISAPTLEIEVLVLGLFVLLVEAFATRIDKRTLAFTAIFGLAAVLVASFFLAPAPADVAATGFWNFYTADPLAIFFKRFALVTTILVLVMMIDYAPIVRQSIHGTTHAIRARRIFRAADLHLRRADVDGLRRSTSS